MGHPCTKSYSLFIYLKFRFNWTPRPFICCNGRLCQGEGGPQERDSAPRIKRVNGTQGPGCRCVPGHFPGVILLRPRSLAYVWSICSLIQPCCALAAVGQGRAPEPPFPGPARLQHPPTPRLRPLLLPSEPSAPGGPVSLCVRVTAVARAWSWVEDGRLSLMTR